MQGHEYIMIIFVTIVTDANVNNLADGKTVRVLKYYKLIRKLFQA